MHFQEIVVHTAVTPKQIAIVLYIFASVLYPIKAETNSDTAEQVNIPYRIRISLQTVAYRNLPLLDNRVEIAEYT